MKYYVSMIVMMCFICSGITFSVTRLYDTKRELRDFAATAAHLNKEIEKSLPDVCAAWALKTKTSTYTNPPYVNLGTGASGRK